MTLATTRVKTRKKLKTVKMVKTTKTRAATRVTVKKRSMLLCLSQKMLVSLSL